LPLHGKLLREAAEARERAAATPAPGAGGAGAAVDDDDDAADAQFHAQASRLAPAAPTPAAGGTARELLAEDDAAAAATQVAALVAAARHDALDDSGWRVRPLELGGFDRDPDLGPVQRVVEAEIPRWITLVGECVVEQVEVTAGRAVAQHGELQPVERVQQASALAQGAGARLWSANALQGHQR
jgi:hypothetical protein